MENFDSKKIICTFFVKGAFFLEFFKQTSAFLAYEWDVLSYEKNEPDLPEYIRRKLIREKELQNKSIYVQYIWSFERYFKLTVSYSILIFMVSCAFSRAFI